jgi:hypothetical protein
MNRVTLVTVAAFLAFLSACQADGPTPLDTVAPDPPVTQAEIRTGYVRNSQGQVVRITFEVRNGLAIREGDVILGRADAIASTPEELTRESGARFGMIFNSKRWPDGVVRYIISDLRYPQRVLDAIAHIKANAPGISFIQLSEAETTGKNFVRFVSGPGCRSHIGMQGGSQFVYLGDGCTTGDVVHEIGHALGMQHEHMRYDRNDHVEILENNIIPDQRFNFKNDTLTGYRDFGQYSESSIMHYGPYEFSRNGLPTIRSRFGRDSEMGQRVRLNQSDVSTLSEMYRAQIQIHRLYHPNITAGGDHLYSLSATEGTTAGYRLEDRDYFRLTLATAPHYGHLYRCYVNQHHYLSRQPYCETGVAAEATLGRVATWQMGGTVPLYRTRDPQTGDRLATISPSERSATLSWGWVNEGILGYVWPGD